RPPDLLSFPTRRSSDLSNFNYSDSDGLQFVSQWQVSQAVDPSSVRIENITYAPISRKDLKQLAMETIPSKLTYSLKTSVARDEMSAYFVMSPIIKEANGSFKKVISFTVGYSNGRLLSGRSGNQRAITNSVLSSG